MARRLAVVSRWAPFETSCGAIDLTGSCVPRGAAYGEPEAIGQLGQQLSDQGALAHPRRAADHHLLQRGTGASGSINIGPVGFQAGADHL